MTRKGIGQENLAALGRIALASTGIEMTVEAMIWALLGVDEPAGRALTEHARPSWLAERLERLAKRTDLDSALVVEVIEFARGAKTRFQVRNDNLHGVWISLEGGTAVRLRSILVDGREGPQFDADVAIASPGMLTEVESTMEVFSARARKLYLRLQVET